MENELNNENISIDDLEITFETVSRKKLPKGSSRFRGNPNLPKILNAQRDIGSLLN